MSVTIGERVRRLREARGWSQRRLGAQAGTSGSYVNQLENGLRPKAGATMLQKLAVALGVSVEELLSTEEAGPYVDTLSPALTELNANLLTIERCNPQALEPLREIILAVKEKAEREYRGRARLRRSSATAPASPEVGRTATAPSRAPLEK